MTVSLRKILLIVLTGILLALAIKARIEELSSCALVNRLVSNGVLLLIKERYHVFLNLVEGLEDYIPIKYIYKHRYQYLAILS
jgi:hypothetical protein